MKKSKRLICLAIALTLLVSMLSLAALAEGKKPLIVAHSADDGTLTPYTYKFDTGLDIVRWIYDPLIMLDAEQAPQPWLATSYEISEDGLTYTFHLAEDAKFHDGEPLTADDVKFTYEYINTYPRSRYTNPAKVISEVKAVDEHTVEMVVSTPQTIEFLTKPLSELGILPEHIWSKVTDPDNATETVGSGPYKLVEVKVGEFYRFEANKEYWNGTPAVDAIYMPIITDANARNTALLSGQVDASSGPIPTELVKQFEASSLSVLKGPAYSTSMVVFNCERHPFDMKEFRQALAYGTNVQEVVDVIMLGNATLGSSGFVHPKMPYYNPDIKHYEYSPEKGNELLDGLGYLDSNGNGTRENDKGEELSFKLLVYASNALRIRIAELLKEYYAQIGVGVEVTALDAQVVDDLVWPEYDATKGRDFDMVMWGWGASTMPVPGRYAEMTHGDLSIGGSNIGGFNNPDINKVDDQILTLINTEERYAAIREFQALLAEEMPFITLYYPNDTYAFNGNVYNGWVFTTGKGIMTVHSLLKAK